MADIQSLAIGAALALAGVVLTAFIHINVGRFAEEHGWDKLLIRLVAILPTGVRRMIEGWTAIRKQWWVWLFLGISIGVSVGPTGFQDVMETLRPRPVALGPTPANTSLPAATVVPRPIAEPPTKQTSPADTVVASSLSQQSAKQATKLIARTRLLYDADMGELTEIDRDSSVLNVTISEPPQSLTAFIGAHDWTVRFRFPKQASNITTKIQGDARVITKVLEESKDFASVLVSTITGHLFGIASVGPIQSGEIDFEFYVEE